MHVHVYLSVQLRTYVYLCICVYVYIYIYNIRFSVKFTRVYKYVCIYVYIHIYHKHTHLQKLRTTNLVQSITSSSEQRPFPFRDKDHSSGKLSQNAASKPTT